MFGDKNVFRVQKVEEISWHRFGPKSGFSIYRVKNQKHAKHPGNLVTCSSIKRFDFLRLRNISRIQIAGLFQKLTHKQ